METCCHGIIVYFCDTLVYHKIIILKIQIALNTCFSFNIERDDLSKKGNILYNKSIRNFQNLSSLPILLLQL